jgi:hypothetical protein
MPVVHHQAVRNYSHVHNFPRVRDETLESCVFVSIRKDWAFSRASIERMVKNAAKGYSPMPRHSDAHRKSFAGPGSATNRRAVTNGRERT